MFIVPDLNIILVLMCSLLFFIKMAEAKRKRAANLTQVERELLVDTVLKYKSVLENKRTDAVSNKEKEDVWKIAADEFNAVTTSSSRDWKQLKMVVI